MQNLSDNSLNTCSSRCYDGVEDELDTFIVYNERKKVTSSAKKKRRHGDKSLHQTPDGSLLEVKTSKGSELQIEVAEFLWRDVQLDGSLIILAENVLGSTRIDENGETILEYGKRCGRCKLENIKILNDGIDWNARENLYWKHDVQRFEAVKGNHVFEVPDDYKMYITTGDSGLVVELKPIEN